MAAINQAVLPQNQDRIEMLPKLFMKRSRRSNEGKAAMTKRIVQEIRGLLPSRTQKISLKIVRNAKDRIASRTRLAVNNHMIQRTIQEKIPEKEKVRLPNRHINQTKNHERKLILLFIIMTGLQGYFQKTRRK
jgi:hypothetical protein